MAAAAAPTFSACSSHQHLKSQSELVDAYRLAIKDAEVAEPTEISRNLVAIVPSNDRLLWKKDDQTAYVLVVTWTSWDGYDNRVGQSMKLAREVWVTVVPELQSFCQKRKLRQNMVLRLEQLLGLPRGNGKTNFAELWVEPKDLFRPTPDPEISDHEAELDFPVSSEFVTVSQKHRDWFDGLKSKSYRDDGYPWTRLGYTYDWGDPENEVGLSEFVVQAGATVMVNAVFTTSDYCKAN